MSAVLKDLSVSTTLEDLSAPQPTLNLFRSIAERDRDRARRRYLRARSMESDQESGAWENEAILPEPPDGEAIHAEPMSAPLFLQSHFDLLLGSEDPRIPVQVNINSSQASASERPEEPLDASSEKRNRTSKDPDETDLAAFGISSGTMTTSGRT